MAQQDTDGRLARIDADDSSYTGGDGGRWVQRVLFAAGASLFVVSLAIVTGAGPLSPIGPVADQDNPDESTPRPGGTVTPTTTGTSAPTPTQTAVRTTDESPSPTNMTDDPLVGIGGTTTVSGNGTTNGTAAPGNQTATPGGTTEEDDDGGIFG